MKGNDETGYGNRLTELYQRNDWIERRLAAIDKHGRRQSISATEETEKVTLQTELNNLIAEVERLESALEASATEKEGMNG